MSKAGQKIIDGLNDALAFAQGDESRATIVRPRPIGSDLYRRIIAFDHGDDDRNAITREVWKPTPWVINAFTGDWRDGRDLEMIEWCHENFGKESSPIHENPGTWHRGSATVAGWTWFGFSTEVQMKQFAERWPPPNADG